ncbi:ribosomal-protein-alanine N-acetyltransferase [Loktanella fryxellensis]|uniref:Ribosomal-protein-alanine N-acetyltransferase n=1 Tax=Loktanella fryxellensis TaxID=245187 RepID=A0A1H8F3G3_9RHOB|nr:GNAT family N-acetyltransferase [Loktanella fryxellensis]SEN25924.1 ribosomal-protein-alanine N-acetyltransferase [Loktanella fryxellensis]
MHDPATGITARNLGPADLDDLHAIGSERSVVRQMGGWPWPPRRDFTATRCRPYAGDGFVWGLDRGGRIVGTVAVTRGELGYMLHPQVSGQGLGTRWVGLAVDHAFATLPLTRIDASAWADNAASAAVLRKLGFVHWQTRFEQAIARGFPVASHHYRLTRATHDRLRNADDCRKATA